MTRLCLTRGEAMAYERFERLKHRLQQATGSTADELAVMVGQATNITHTTLCNRVEDVLSFQAGLASQGGSLSYIYNRTAVKFGQKQGETEL